MYPDRVIWPFTRRAARPRAQTFSIADPLLVRLFGGDGMSLAGVAVNERSALGISAFYRAGALITSTIAGLPLRSLRTRADEERERVRSWLDDPAGPDSYTPFEWAEIALWHVFCRGNAYLMHRFNGAGAFVGTHPVHPAYVTPCWDSTRPGGKRFDVALDPETARRFNDGKTLVSFDALTMTQVMGPTLDGLRGMSVLEVARTSLGASIAGDRAGAVSFARGPLISMLVTPDEDMEDDEADLIKSELESRMTGAENAGAVAVVNRRLKFQPWSLSATDAQFLESRQFQVEEVARWTGVPPHLLMQTEKQTSWGTGVQEQNRGLRQYNLLGWTQRFEQRLSRLLPRPQFAEFDFAGLERPNAQDEIRLLMEQVNNGFLTLNEARRIRNLPPLPGGDVLRAAPGSPAPATTLTVAQPWDVLRLGHPVDTPDPPRTYARSWRADRSLLPAGSGADDERWAR